MSNKVVIKKLGKEDRSSFRSGVLHLDNFIKVSAGQDNRKNLSVTYILSVEDKIIGFYCISASNINLSSLPDEDAKKLSRHPYIPAILLGRLAVDCNFRGKGYGKILVADALKRCLTLSESLGSYAVIVDAKDIQSEAFYQRFGFIPFENSRRLFLPIASIKSVYETRADSKRLKTT